MKIIQLIQRKQQRGAEIFSAQLAQHLKNQGHEVLIISLLDGPAVLPFDGTIITLEANLQNRWFDWKAWKKLANVINEFNADVIQANAADTLKYAVFSKLLFRWKSKLVFRNANKMGDFIHSTLHLWLNKFFVNRVDYVVSVSDLCKNDFINTFDYSGKKIATIPIGVDVTSTASYSDLSMFGISKDAFVFLSVASFVPEKNHQGLIEIFKQIHVVYPHTKLLLLGEGKTKKQIQEYVAQIGLQEAVFFGGVRTDVLQIMPLCTALLMPSFIEGLPAVILEAFLSRLPVIAYNVGGISEVLTKETGWIIEKNNMHDFVKSIKELLTVDDTERLSMVNNAYHSVSNNHHNLSLSKKFERVYTSLMDNREENIA